MHGSFPTTHKPSRNDLFRPNTAPKMRKKTPKITTERSRSTILGEERADRDHKIDKDRIFLFCLGVAAAAVGAPFSWGTAAPTGQGQRRCSSNHFYVVRTYGRVRFGPSDGIGRSEAEISTWRGALFCGIVGLGSEISACCSTWAFCSAHRGLDGPLRCRPIY